MKVRFVLLSAVLFAYSLCIGQSFDSLKVLLPSAKEDTSKVKLLLKIAIAYRNTDPEQAIPYANEAKNLAIRLNYPNGVALAFKYVGLAYLDQSKYVQAIENFNNSLKVFEEMNDKVGVSNLQNNIGVVYKEQGLDEKALDFFFNSLKNAEEAGDLLRITTALNNIGSVYDHKMTTITKATDYYLQALPKSEQLGDPDLIGSTLGNIGETYLKVNKPDSALYFFNKQEQQFKGTGIIAYALNNIGKANQLKKDYKTALIYHQRAYDSAVAVNSTLFIAQSLQGLAAVYDSTGDYAKAREVLSKAEKLAVDLESLYDTKDIYNAQAFTYAKLNDFKNAWKYETLLVKIKDNIYNKEADLKAVSTEFNFQVQQKESVITLQKLSIERQNLTRNALLAGFGLILVIVVILYRNYRNKIKVNRILDMQKAQIETLLSNILPTEVSRELQATGEATPRFYESVSVLFTDFKGFTVIADSLSPQEVVAELSEIFTTFDNIIEKHGLEKIKTIGDAYMCAGGIPVENSHHPVDMVKAAIEIVHYMRHKNLKRRLNGQTPWEMRIGIHTGPVVAGVVGRKKYAYDIWGSTVNIASRMESNSEQGEINISAATYDLVKDHFECSYRGKIYAKNVGDIDMYFVKESWIKPSVIATEDVINSAN